MGERGTDEERRVVEIRKPPGKTGWYFYCPDHHIEKPGLGPFNYWDQARIIADLHLSNYNHFF